MPTRPSLQSFERPSLGSFVTDTIPTEKSPNYFQRVGAGFQDIGRDITQSIKTGAEAIPQGGLQATGKLLRTGLETAGGVARAAFTPILEAPGIKQAVEFGVKKALEQPNVRKVVDFATDIVIKYPNAARDAQNLFDIVTLGYAPKGLGIVAKESKAISSDISRGIDIALTPSEEAVQQGVIELFQKSIKPTAKKTLAQGERYENNILTALKSIKTNAERLNIEDATGELVSRTPQSINELSQAVEQTKGFVFEQYDALARQAGREGVEIDMSKIADELDTVVNNKALQLARPNAVKYAKETQERLRKFDIAPDGKFIGTQKLDPQTLQEVIKFYNQSLQNFYKNPTYESASEAGIDALVVNNLRKALDDAIEGATGKEYQVLKDQYSALKAIENDVVRATNRDARKNVRGLLDYTDIFTGGQMIGGILSLNPAMFTKGAVERGFKEWIKALNDPNRAVGNMFEKLDIDTSLKFEPQSSTGKFLKNPKIGLSIEDVSGKSSLAQEAQTLDISKGKKLTPQQDKTLIAVHNLTASKLAKADKIGGFANPSIAIFDPKVTKFESFGDITLIAPQDLMKGAKVFASDAYTPRFPSTSTKIDWKKAAQVEKETGIDLRSGIDTEDFFRSAENSKEIMAHFLKTRGLKPKGDSIYEMREQLAPLKDEYVQFIDDLARDVGVEERIFKGFTYSGNRRYSPLTVENASKEMNKKSVADGEGFFYGLGSVRAKVTPRLANITAIRNARNRILSKEEFTKVKEVYEADFGNLVEELNKKSKHKDSNPFTQFDQTGHNLGSYLAGDKAVMTDFFDKVSPELLKKIEDFRMKLLTMPTEYFEGKFRRPVSINEFSHAVVPEETTPATIKLLEDKGISVVTYKKGEGNQAKKLLEYVSENGMLFGITGLLVAGAATKQ